MSLDTRPIKDAISSHAQATGQFDKVTGHEPKNAPGNGVWGAIWRQNTRAIALASGLAATSARVLFIVRIFINMLSDPQDEIDPRQDAAADALFTELVGDFTLGGTVRNIDVLGEFGDPLDLEAGYLDQDHKLFRVVDIKIPVIVNDVWEQVP